MTDKVKLFSYIKNYTVLVDDVEYKLTEQHDSNTGYSDTTITGEDGEDITDDEYNKVYDVFMELRRNE